jgi:iron complex transport system substrate-binding protein
MVYALGAGAELVGRSHECDYPAFVLDLPVVSRPALDLDNASPAAIDSAVTQQLADGATLYTIDEKLLRSLEPEVILTQNLCRVCAPSGDELTRAVRKFDVMPEVLFLTPRTIGEISDNVRTVGDAIGRAGNARAIIADSESRLQRVKDAVRSGRKRRVVFLEWINPFFSAGHWVPEMISIAGGEDPLGRAGEDSVRIEWDDVVAAEPEAIVVSPCGYRLDRAAELARELPIIEGVEVYAVDANAYFARPGPRVAEGVELLAHLLHPDLVRWTMPDPAWERIR